MKTISKIKKITLTLFILLSMFAVFGSVLGATVYPDAPAPTMQIGGKTLFCGFKGRAISSKGSIGWAANRSQFNDAELMQLDSKGTRNIEKSVAYGVYYYNLHGGDKMGIQRLVWNSDQWTGSSDMIDGEKKTPAYPGGSDLEQRALQYGAVYYGIFNNLNGDKLFKDLTDYEKVYVYVDQDEQLGGGVGTYTVGPYKIKLDLKDTGLTYKKRQKAGQNYVQEGAKYLYNEIVTSITGKVKNQGWTKESAYAEFKGLEGLEATGKVPNDIKFVDKNGEIDFPDITKLEGTEFYIKFHGTSKETTGKPNLKIECLTDLNGEYEKYMVPEGNPSDWIHYYGSVHVSMSNLQYGWKAYYDTYGCEFYNYGDYVMKSKFSSVPFTADVLLDVKVVRSSKSADDPLNGEGKVHIQVPMTVYPAYSTEEPNAAGEMETWYHYWGYNYWGAFYDISPELFAVNGSGINVGSISMIVVQVGGMSQQIQTFDAILLGGGSGGGSGGGGSVTPTKTLFEFEMKEKKINEYIGGYVWEDAMGAKGANAGNGSWDGQGGSDGDRRRSGILVTLYEIENNGSNEGGSVFGTVCTDDEGRYKFEHLDPYKDYYVTFTYNGQIYQASTYHPYTPNGEVPAIISQGPNSGFSQAYENSEDRETLNNRFLNIYSTPASYNGLAGWNIGYGVDQIVPGDGRTFGEMYEAFLQAMAGGSGYDYDGHFPTIEGKSLAQFMRDCEITTRTQTYPALFNRFIIKNEREPESAGATGSNETVGGKVYYYLYTDNNNQFIDVDFAINKRETPDLALQKDLYKAAVVVNGKRQEYYYSKKNVNPDSGTWDVEVRRGDALYNGAYRYNRELRKSEYLYTSQYDDNIQNDAKNLQVYVTYRIAVKNQGNYDTSINEIVDYYDADMYEYDGVLNGEVYTNNNYNEYDPDGNVTGTYVNSYIGRTSNDKKRYINDNPTQLVARSTSRFNKDGRNQYVTTLNGSNYNYNTLYISSSGNNIDSSIDSGNGEIRNSIPTYRSGQAYAVLKPGELCYAYVTFKVKLDPDSHKVILDQDLSRSHAWTVGKKNIAEINAYSTYYVDGATIPSQTKGGAIPDGSAAVDYVGGKRAGVFDRDSNPGSLRTSHLNADGDILADSMEDDTDKSPNFRLIIDESDEDVRRYGGNVFEDVRNVNSSSAIIGNGEYNTSDEDGNNDKDKAINGVKVELVELVQEVDENGIFKGKYLGERVWSSEIYAGNYSDNYSYWTQVTGGANDQLRLTGKTDGYYEIVDGGNSLTDKNIKQALVKNPVINDRRYYSGIGQEKVILSGVGPVLSVVPKKLNDLDGSYMFASLPAGDFIIRYTYGDTTQTVLVNDANNEVNKTVGNLVDGYTGLNSKSYNGQDYKSTGYQLKLNNNGTVADSINQGGSYNKVNGYTVYDVQNYSYLAGGEWKPTTNLLVSDVNNNEANNYKPTMYYFDIAEHDNHPSLSDAKDVYSYRNKTNNFSTGYSSGSYEVDSSEFRDVELLNHRAEVLRSFEKMGTYTGDDNEAIKLLNQQEMLIDLMYNTQMVAQTGIISTEVERNVKETGNQGNENKITYTITDINFGLQERPEAQLKLSKEVSNFRLITENNQTLFDTNQAVNNLIYTQHGGHSQEYQNKFGDYRRLLRVYLSANSKQTPELIQAALDDELMKGSKVTIDYTLRIDNIGEIDYLDNKFYYTGLEDNPGDYNNVSKTTPLEVLDYVANVLEYDRSYQSTDAVWTVRPFEYVTNSSSVNANNAGVSYNIADYTSEIRDILNGNREGYDRYENSKASVELDRVNREYYDRVTTYEQLITTNSLAGTLFPWQYNKEHGDAHSSVATTLVLKTEITSNNGAENLVYNNLAEITSTHNSQGRRMQYSVSGNQQMADQRIGDNAAIDYYSSVDLVTPEEIDADSAQTIRLTPPTGANLNYMPIILALIAATGLIAVAVIIIKTKIAKK